MIKGTHAALLHRIRNNASLASETAHLYVGAAGDECNFSSTCCGCIFAILLRCLTPFLHRGDAFSGGGLRGWEFCPICPFFTHFFTFTKIPQVPSFQAHSPVKTVFRQNPKNARKSQNTPSTNPYQNETQFPLSSLKNVTSGHARPPKSALCLP